MYKLYYSPGACSMAIHVALNEMNLDFQLKNVASPKGQPKSAEFLKLNPLGTVPVLEVDGVLLREGAAILIYLLDKHHSDLLPKNGIKRAKALEWLLFANATMHPAYSRCFFQYRFLGEQTTKNPLYEPSIAQIQKYWDMVEKQLESNDYICGEELTIADILLTVIANWSFFFGDDAISFGTKTKALFTKVISRPSYKKALEIEAVKYKANL